MLNDVKPLELKAKEVNYIDKDGKEHVISLLVTEVFGVELSIKGYDTTSSKILNKYFFTEERKEQ